jgi:hypothetical protein
MRAILRIMAKKPRRRYDSFTFAPADDWVIGYWLTINRHNACAVKRRWSTAGESPARELGSLHPEAIGAAVEETKPSEPPV